MLVLSGSFEGRLASFLQNALCMGQRFLRLIVCYNYFLLMKMLPKRVISFLLIFFSYRLLSFLSQIKKNFFQARLFSGNVVPLILCKVMTFLFTLRQAWKKIKSFRGRDLSTIKPSAKNTSLNFSQ